MNAFEKLGLRPSLVISEEEIRKAFRKNASETHPDGGADGKDFSELQRAQEILLSPSKRLKEWLIVSGGEAETRGTIGGEMMDLFQKVAEAGAAAETAIKVSEKAHSSLAKAMAEISLMKEREKIKTLLEAIRSEISGRVGGFERLEAGEPDPSTEMRDLVFLEKWQGTLKGLYGRLM